MNKIIKDFSKIFPFPVATLIIIFVIAIVGISALANGPYLENPFNQKSLYPTNNNTAIDYYHCPNCNTVVPCPNNHNGYGRSCPSCGLGMNVRRGYRNAYSGNQGLYYSVAGGLGGNAGQGLGGAGNIVCPPGSNYNLAGGFGGNGGQGLGIGGNIVCPDCGFTMPHQRGVACFNIQCPKCGASMSRQLNANIPTLFFRNGRNSGNPNLQRGYPAAAAPPITSNAKLMHQYRGVCSNCHQIIDRPR